MRSLSPNDISSSRNHAGENSNNNTPVKKGTPFEKVFISSWGFAKYGQLCSPMNGGKISGPILIESLPTPPFNLSAGESHTAIITQNLELFVAGGNNYGQLGIEDVKGNLYKPTIVPVNYIFWELDRPRSYFSIANQFFKGIKISAVSCGSDHTFALTTKGEVYAWGLNFKGQLGLGDYENRPIPTLVSSLLPNVNALKDGEKTSLKKQKSSIDLKTEGNRPQQTLEKNNRSSSTSNLLDFLNNQNTENELFLLSPDEKVTQIVCGTVHTMVKTDKNRVFSCGFGETFALGHGDNKTLNQFKEITYFKDPSFQKQYLNSHQIDRIGAGLSHSACIINGRAYLWGMCSSDDKLTFKLPTLIGLNNHSNAKDSGSLSPLRKAETEINDVIDLKLGECFTLILRSKGDLFIIGDNLGAKGSQSKIFENPQRLNEFPSNLRFLSCGRQHVIGITSEKKAIGWGSNIYGQILPGGDSVYSNPVFLNHLKEADPFRIICGSFHTLCLSYNNVILDGMDTQSTNEPSMEKSVASLKADLTKLQEEYIKLKREHEFTTKKNIHVISEYEKLRQEVTVLKKTNKDQEVSPRAFEKPKPQVTEIGVQTTESSFAKTTNTSAENKENEENGAVAGEKREDFKKFLQKHKNPMKTKLQFFHEDTPMPTPRQFTPQFEIDFNELVLEKQISEGGYGIIYRGRWRETVVAVKMLKIDGISESHVRDFLSECKAMEALRHPNICMFLGACTKPPKLAIVLEFCTRGTLWSLLQNLDINLSWDDRRKLALDTAKGVHYLHSFNPPILHRDLKSLNILLDDGYRIKLADFGWTRTLGKEMTGKIGTYQWMAPEVIKGQNYSEKADVFSFGIILWEIASREPPYRNINGLQVSLDVVNIDRRPEIPKATPPNFVKLIKKCWDKNPDSRPSFKEIIKELESLRF